MLALIASRIAGPVEETADRDPGIVTLAFTIARAFRTRADAAFARRCEYARRVGGPTPL